MAVSDDLFWSKVQKTDTCWIYTGRKDKDGYGRLKRGAKMLQAHRYAWELTNGPICVRACVRPDHVRPGTQAQNMRDRDRDGTTARGSRNGRSKLTAEQVLELRARAGAGERVGDLARAFGITWNAAADIIRRKNWAHLGEAA